jgi:thioredoxin-related protein
MLKFVMSQIHTMVIRKFLVGAALLTGMLFLNSWDTPKEGRVQWLTFEQAVEKAKTDKRPIFIDVYTDWCGYCKVMDKNTFADAVVADLLNTKFHAVKFNAEQKEDVVYGQTTFKFVDDGGRGYHQLAVALLNKKLSYPTVVFLSEDFGMIQPLPGYRPAPEFHKFAQFVGEGHYKAMKWNDWEKIYKSPYEQGEKPNN